jgi:O-antigen/teichoic acid export membrane protein
LGLGRLTLANLPLAGADAVEWGTRKLDIAILAQFAPAEAVGVYYVAQQIASLPQKLKSSFEPILGPVITRNLAENNLSAIARQLCQVGFWITAAQAGIALALGIPAKAVMGLVGPHFVGGTGAAAFLLLAEVMAAPAVVSEAALIYIAPVRNLLISLGTIVVQAGLTVAFIVFLRTLPDWDLPPWMAVDAAHLPFYQAAAVAAALALTLALSSAVKSRLVRYLLGGKVSNWRWALVAAALPTCLIGWAAHLLPEWLELLAGIPVMLGCYMAMIWRLGFGPEDRVLFRKSEHGLAA